MLPEIQRELRMFAERTTVKGIGRTVKAHKAVARTCWIVFLFVCLALLMFQVSAPLHHASRKLLSYRKLDNNDNRAFS